MTCTERAKRMDLFATLTEAEKRPASQYELHDLLHEVLMEKYGEISDEIGDTMLAKMRNEKYELLWLEAVRRLRKRKSVILEQHVYA